MLLKTLIEHLQEVEEKHPDALVYSNSRDAGDG